MAGKEERDKIIADLNRYSAAHGADYYLVVWTPSGKEKGKGEVKTSYAGERGAVVEGKIGTFCLGLYK